MQCKPGGQRGIAPELAQATMGPDKRVLSHFLSIRLIVQRLVRQRATPRIITFDDLCKSGLITAVETLDQHRIIGGLDFIVGHRRLTVVLKLDLSAWLGAERDVFMGWISGWLIVVPSLYLTPCQQCQCLH